MSPALRQVGRYWAALQARDWALARAQLAPDAVCRWWATGEGFEGADAVIHINAVYPEGWTIFLLELEPLGAEASGAHMQPRFDKTGFIEIALGRQLVQQRIDDGRGVAVWHAIVIVSARRVAVVLRQGA